MPREYLNRIGYWKKDLFDERFALPHDFVGKYEPTRKAALLDHLQSGTQFLVWRAETCCHLCEAHIGWAELTDGRLAWPEGLAHYVEMHDVVLPDWVSVGPPEKGMSRFDEERWSRVEIDDGRWIRWCASHRRGEFDDRLSERRRLALERARVAIARILERYESGASGAAILHSLDGHLPPIRPGTDLCSHRCGQAAMANHSLCLRCHVDARIEPMAKALAVQCVSLRAALSTDWTDSDAAFQVWETDSH